MIYHDLGFCLFCIITRVIASFGVPLWLREIKHRSTKRDFNAKLYYCTRDKKALLRARALSANRSGNLDDDDDDDDNLTVRSNK